MRQAMVLASPQAVTTNDGVSRNLFDAWAKLRQLRGRIEGDFEKAIQNHAQQIATADPATFDIATFVTGWTQQLETYRKSKEAVATFEDQLEMLFDGWAGYGSAEFIQAAKQKRQELQHLLAERNRADTVIEQQIAALDTLIDSSKAGKPVGAEQTLAEPVKSWPRLKGYGKSAQPDETPATDSTAQEITEQPGEKAEKEDREKVVEEAAKESGKEAAKETKK